MNDTDYIIDEQLWCGLNRGNEIFVEEFWGDLQRQRNSRNDA